MVNTDVFTSRNIVLSQAADEKANEVSENKFGKKQSFEKPQILLLKPVQGLNLRSMQIALEILRI